jgi:hypothetical protein
MACHNSRRGQQGSSPNQYFTTHDDAHWSLITSKTQTAHPPTQADLLMGQNAYFVSNIGESEHKFIENTCVNCHMDLTKPIPALSYQGGDPPGSEAATNHAFVADPNVCSNCHLPPITATGVQNAINSQLLRLNGALATGYWNLLKTATGITLPADNPSGRNPVTGCGQEEITPADINSLVWNGTTSLTINYFNHTTGDTNASCVNADPANILLTGAAADNLYDLSLTATPGQDGALLKAGWNYVLVDNDPGKGVHNPEFCADALAGAYNALQPLLQPPPMQASN